MVQESGLRVSFDLQRLEDVIAGADVSRSAAYKRWPRMELFYSQVLLRLAREIRAKDTIPPANDPRNIPG